jgi:hypothetical protein
MPTPPAHPRTGMSSPCHVNGGRYGRSLHVPANRDPAPAGAGPAGAGPAGAGPAGAGLVSGRHGRGAPDGQDSSQTAADVEASAAAIAIAGLRWRLRRQEILEHPRVLGELQKLEAQLADQRPARPAPGASPLRGRRGDRPADQRRRRDRSAAGPAQGHHAGRVHRRAAAVQALAG